MTEEPVPRLSIIIPAWNEGENLAVLLPRLAEAAAGIGADWEIIVADHESRDGTVEICRALKVRYLGVPAKGYGSALRAAFAAAQGEFLLTMDADLSHPTDFIRDLWANRRRADMIVASRFVEGGSADMPFSRLVLSRILNWTFRRALSVPVRDLSSGFRLYRRAVLDDIDPVENDFNILQEILIKACALGYRVREVPFAYHRRGSGSSRARLFAFGIQYLKTLGRMWALRNSISSGDYDRRAYDSRIPMQRWWQRKRYRIIVDWAASSGPALDVGCGSSRILEGLPEGSVGVDPSLADLRYARLSGRPVAAGRLPRLPVADGQFDTVVCSQVIEHIPPDREIFAEFHRLLRPGGQLILGTPDYGRLAWRVTEALYHFLIPGGYADDHITRYQAETLTGELESAGFEVREKRYIGGGELILRCRRT